MSKEDREEFPVAPQAIIRALTPAEKERFPDANLVKEWLSDEVRKAETSYWYGVIAYTLFPDNFIEVVGYESIPNKGRGGEPELEPGGLFYKKSALNKLYSKEAAVDADHATYTRHMVRQTDLTTPADKAFVCSCEVCSRHNPVHETLKDDLEVMIEQLDEAGIHVPREDPTDYCLAGGNLVFFEIDLINPVRVRRYMESKRLSKGARKRVEEGFRALNL